MMIKKGQKHLAIDLTAIKHVQVRRCKALIRPIDRLSDDRKQGHQLTRLPACSTPSPLAPSWSPIQAIINSIRGLICHQTDKAVFCVSTWAKSLTLLKTSKQTPTANNNMAVFAFADTSAVSAGVEHQHRSMQSLYGLCVWFALFSSSSSRCFCYHAFETLCVCVCCW